MREFHSIITLLFFLITVLTLRTIQVLLQIRNSKRRVDTKTNAKPRSKAVKTLVVLGSGGHTTEMLQLLSSLSPKKYTPLSYVVASTDTTSMNRIYAQYESQSQTQQDNNGSNPSKDESTCSNTKTQQKLPQNDHNSTNKLPPIHNHTYKIPRAREVGQSYLTSIFTTINSILQTAHIVLIQCRPDLLIINGPGTCLPVALWTFVGRVLGMCEGRIIFSESFCRVESLSLTGKILRFCGIVDLFLVHWEELMERYGSSGDGKDSGFILMESFMMHS